MIVQCLERPESQIIIYTKGFVAFNFRVTCCKACKGSFPCDIFCGAIEDLGPSYLGPSKNLVK